MLKEFHNNFYSFLKEDLEEFYLSGNSLAKFSLLVLEMGRLRVLWADGNSFDMVPSGLYKMQSLVEFKIDWFKYLEPMRNTLVRRTDPGEVYQ